MKLHRVRQGLTLIDALRFTDTFSHHGPSNPNRKHICFPIRRRILIQVFQKMINKPIHLQRDRKSQCSSNGFHNKSVNCITCWQRCRPLVYYAPFQWATVFPQLVLLLNAPVLRRNACPYVPSSAQSHWSLSHSEQTIVKPQNKNERNTCKLVAYQDIPGTEGDVLNCDLALILYFASKVLALCEKNTHKKKHLQLHLKTHTLSPLLLSICNFGGVRGGAEKGTLLFGVK